MMTTTAYDRLPADLREVVSTAAVKFGMRINETTRVQDEELLGGLFAKQGVRSMPVSPLLRAQFLEAAHAARDRLGARPGAEGALPTGAIVSRRLPQRASLI